MALIAEPFILDSPTADTPARVIRLAKMAAFAPEVGYGGAPSGVRVRSGLLPGVSGSAGEVEVLTPTSAVVRSFYAVIQGSANTTQGGYVVINDADTTLTLTDRDASLYRRSLLVARVADTVAAGGADPGDDDAEMVLLDGPLAATADGSALPAAGDNALPLGYFTIPPVGGTVTWTPYNPRAATRGGILLADPTGVHAAAAPVHRGQYRDHPSLGLQRGLASGGDWETVNPRQRYIGGDSGGDGTSAGTSGKTIASTTITVPAGLPAGSRIKYEGWAFIECPANAAPVMSFGSGRGERIINRPGGNWQSDIHIRFLDTDLTPGSRTIPLRLAASQVEDTITYRQPRLYVEIL